MYLSSLLCLAQISDIYHASDKIYNTTTNNNHHYRHQLADRKKERHFHGFHACLCSFFEMVNRLSGDLRKKRWRETRPHPNCDHHCIPIPWSLVSRKLINLSREAAQASRQRTALLTELPSSRSNTRLPVPPSARPHLPQQNNMQTLQISRAPWQSLECATLWLLRRWRVTVVKAWNRIIIQHKTIVLHLTHYWYTDITLLIATELLIFLDRCSAVFKQNSFFIAIILVFPRTILFHYTGRTHHTKTLGYEKHQFKIT